MDAAYLNVSPTDARIAIRHYAAALKQRHNEEWATLLRGYRAILRGRRVIDLQATILSAGVDAELRPELAVARADCRWVRARRVSLAHDDAGGVLYESLRHRNDWKGPRNAAARVTIRGFAPTRLFPFGPWHYAMVPAIPPQHSPGESRLREYVLLFDAAWQRTPLDPILLRPLGGPLYAVVAVWDLTPLERAVLADSRSRE